jgi:transcriptional regulator with XRE-family HTH domain
VPLGPLLRRARQARDILQDDLAKQLGVAVSTLSDWERDKREPPASMLRDLCRILHVSADVLLERAPFELGPMPAKETP